MYLKGGWGGGTGADGTVRSVELSALTARATVQRINGRSLPVRGASREAGRKGAEQGRDGALSTVCACTLGARCRGCKAVDTGGSEAGVGSLA